MTEETTGPVATDNTAPTPATPFFDPADVETSVKAAVASWVATLRGTPISRNTGAWNALQDSLPHLVVLTVKEIIK